MLEGCKQNEERGHIHEGRGCERGLEPLDHPQEGNGKKRKTERKRSEGENFAKEHHKVFRCNILAIFQPSDVYVVGSFVQKGLLE